MDPPLGVKVILDPIVYENWTFTVAYQLMIFCYLFRKVGQFLCKPKFHRDVWIYTIYDQPLISLIFCCFCKKLVNNGVIPNFSQTSGFTHNLTNFFWRARNKNRQLTSAVEQVGK